MHRGQAPVRNGEGIEMQVDPIQEGSGELDPVSLDLNIGAGTFLFAVSRKAAGIRSQFIGTPNVLDSFNISVSPSFLKLPKPPLNSLNLPKKDYYTTSDVCKVRELTGYFQVSIAESGRFQRNRHYHLVHHKCQDMGYPILIAKSACRFAKEAESLENENLGQDLGDFFQLSELLCPLHS